MTYKDIEKLETFLILNDPEQYINNCLEEVHEEYRKNNIEDIKDHVFLSLNGMLRQNLESKTVNLEIIELIISSIDLLFTFIDEDDISKKKVYIKWEFDLNKIWNFNKNDFNLIIGFNSNVKRSKKEQLHILTHKINELIKKQEQIAYPIFYDTGFNINPDSSKILSCNI